MSTKSRTRPNQTDGRGIDAIVKLAILAVGGQGGGVLSNWIVDLAKRNNYHVQSTSVAGVAQRTGATIYYIEMLPIADQASKEHRPVFSLSPSPGDIDIVVAAELMESGRAIMRGFVTPEQTTLITSTHRAFATAEKTKPGNAIADSGVVLEHAKNSCNRLIAFDMERIAVESGSVVSASLFGAIAGSAVLPFAQESFEKTIRASGRGVEASLAAFRTARDEAGKDREPETMAPVPTGLHSCARPKGPAGLVAEWETLRSRIHTMPVQVHNIAEAGLQKVVDFQDLAYGAEYLARLEEVLLRDKRSTHHKSNFALTAAAAKYIANAMAYDDIIRVADIKTRKSRFDEIRNQAGYDNSKALLITEYFHPGGAEFCSLMPARLGRFIEQRPGLFNKLDWLVNRGRRVRTDTIFWFTVLYLVSGLRKYRRKLLRHSVEQSHVNLLINTALAKTDDNYPLAVEIFNCQRLIKGYSDTHKRGLSKFDKVLAGIKLAENRPDAADQAKRLRQLALDSVDSKNLDMAIKSLSSQKDAPA